jgi:serine/threonine protein kinase
LAKDGAAASGLGLSRLWPYAAQILRGLHELHQRGVVMADLRPANLLLDDELGELVLSDFGRSTVISTAAGVDSMESAVGQGMPHYM